MSRSHFSRTAALEVEIERSDEHRVQALFEVALSSGTRGLRRKEGEGTIQEVERRPPAIARARLGRPGRNGASRSSLGHVSAEGPADVAGLVKNAPNGGGDRAAPQPADERQGAAPATEAKATEPRELEDQKSRSEDGRKRGAGTGGPRAGFSGKPAASLSPCCGSPSFGPRRMNGRPSFGS